MYSGKDWKLCTGAKSMSVLVRTAFMKHSYSQMATRHLTQLKQWLCFLEIVLVWCSRVWQMRIMGMFFARHYVCTHLPEEPLGWECILVRLSNFGIEFAKWGEEQSWNYLCYGNTSCCVYTGFRMFRWPNSVSSFKGSPQKILKIALEIILWVIAIPPLSRNQPQKHTL